jgi:hypothetical protein
VAQVLVLKIAIVLDPDDVEQAAVWSQDTRPVDRCERRKNMVFQDICVLLGTPNVVVVQVIKAGIDISGCC